MICFIHLYNGGGTDALDLNAIAGYADAWVRNIHIDSRKEFVSHHLGLMPAEKSEEAATSLALKLAQSKVQNVTAGPACNDPLYGEIEYEKRWLRTSKRKPIGILYDGFALQSIYFNLLPENETHFGHIHIAFTNQLLGTWDEHDLRYHVRVSAYGCPSIISTTGLVEAPAKPREFYLKKNLGADTLALKKEFAGRFIDYDDPRTTEVMKGYVMQALFYHLTGDPFCEDRDCRLYNGHWQQEVIHAQLEGAYEFCIRHEEALTRLGDE